MIYLPLFSYNKHVQINSNVQHIFYKKKIKYKSHYSTKSIKKQHTVCWQTQTPDHIENRFIRTQNEQKKKQKWCVPCHNQTFYLQSQYAYPESDKYSVSLVKVCRGRSETL